MDIDKISSALRGKQCFLVPISYQTVYISGTPEEIKNQAIRLYEKLALKSGGLIGWIEEYSTIGMPRENYIARAEAFNGLGR
jgi:uroporphyrinogen decarboxylase